ncbi:MAG: dTDP-4-dehydrorhamnose 3,5-epimerase [Leptospiraceae bacterium]|nr:dTDP-4-dehydrorhamnose 3,5-epimerase [Leptospiraceae bacterium]MCP5493140.1 dTDP-4-dehydrorhamnose 3,5-epimerase [Leptospiraceae bacterium]
MKVTETGFSDLYILEPIIHKDGRGFFFESYSQKKFAESGIHSIFVQDNHVKSSDKNVLRGLHYQKPPYAQSKLIRVVKGSIYDVVVDLRKSSKTFKQWYGVELSDKNFKQLFVPRGFAHAYLTLESNCEVLYKVDNVYDPKSEGGVLWNDPELSIDWQVFEPIVSEKDKKLQTLSFSLDIFQ